MFTHVYKMKCSQCKICCCVFYILNYKISRQYLLQKSQVQNHLIQKNLLQKNLLQKKLVKLGRLNTSYLSWKKTRTSLFYLKGCVSSYFKYLLSVKASFENLAKPPLFKELPISRIIDHFVPTTPKPAT